MLPEIRWQICFFDLGLEEQMAGYTKGSCWSLVSEYPARDSVPQIAEPGVNLSSVSKEELLATGCDFLIGWDSVFSELKISVQNSVTKMELPCISHMYAQTVPHLKICTKTMRHWARFFKWKKLQSRKYKK